MDSFELIVVVGAIVIAFFAIIAYGIHTKYSLLSRLADTHEELVQKVDALSEDLDGLRVYLYEIDPQFDDERRARAIAETVDHFAAEKSYEDLLKRKKEAGMRVLSTRFRTIHERNVS